MIAGIGTPKQISPGPRNTPLDDPKSTFETDTDLSVVDNNIVRLDSLQSDDRLSSPRLIENSLMKSDAPISEGNQEANLVKAALSTASTLGSMVVAGMYSF